MRCLTHDCLTGQLFEHPPRDIAGDDFSDDRTYRYSLWRIWDQRKPLINFCMLNPSSATWDQLDPTCTRVLGFVQRWGGGGMVISNCFALVNTDPKALIRHSEAIGPRNDQAIALAAKRCAQVVLAWGNGARLNGRADAVYRLLSAIKPALYCLTVTDTGEPGHPLYLPSDAKPRPYCRVT